MAWYEYRRYVPVAERRRDASRALAKRTKKGLPVDPVVIEGRTIARTFWGKAWCDNLERYSDFSNRLPRGRTYARNGSIVHLGIGKGRVEALVQGSSLYEVTVGIAPLSRPRWKALVTACSGAIDSVVELLRGKLSSGVMRVVTDPARGLFPAPAHIEMTCTCPDWASMCKHIAAVLYGVGARLDRQPDLLFVLRGVDPVELIGASTAARPAAKRQGANVIEASDLESVFGIELDAAPSRRPKRRAARR